MPAEMARGARALQALNQFEDAQAAFRDAATAAPRDPAINTAWGEFFLERQCQTCNTEAVKSFQMALEQDPRYVPAIFGLTRAVANDNPPAAIGTARKILEINPSHVETHLFLAGQAADAGKRDEARQLIQKALAVNPSSLDAHSLLAALAYVEDKTPEFEAQVGQGARDVAGTRRGLPRGRGIHGARLPLRRSGDARPARARHRPAAPAGARRSRHVPAPHRRRGWRAQRARNLLQAEPVRRRHLQPARDDGHARHVHHRRAGRHRAADRQGRRPRAPGHDAGTRAPRPRHAEQAVPVHAEGTDPDRDVPEARSLRRPHGGSAGHDRRARRLLRPRGHARFAAGAPGRVPVGSDALARAGARHHAADVEPAAAAMAERGHLGVRGNRRARPAGGAVPAT